MKLSLWIIFKELQMHIWRSQQSKNPTVITLTCVFENFNFLPEPTYSILYTLLMREQSWLHFTQIQQYNRYNIVVNIKHSILVMRWRIGAGGTVCSVFERLSCFIQRLHSLHAGAISIIITVKYLWKKEGCVVMWLHGQTHLCSQVIAKENRAAEM